MLYGVAAVDVLLYLTSERSSFALFLCSRVDCSGLQSGHRVFWRDLQWTAGVVALWAVWYYCERNNGAESLGTAALLCSRLLSVPRMSFRKMTKKVKQLTLYITFTRWWNDWQAKIKENLDCLISLRQDLWSKFYVWERYTEKIGWWNNIHTEISSKFHKK